MDLTRFSPEWEKYDSSNDSVGIETNFNFSFNKTERILKCATNLTFIQENQPFLKSELQTFYEITKESVEGLTSENVITIPRGLLCQFASLAYGSFRGIIHMKTINTDLSNLILPPLYLDEVIKGDMKIPLK
jgi:hypothetical protein